MTDIDRLTYSVPEAAEAIGVSHDLIETLLERGLPSMKIGRRRLIVKTALTRWLDEHQNSTLTIKGE